MAITGTTILLACVESLQVIWRSGTCRFHLRLPDHQMNCRYFTIREGTWIVTPAMTTSLGDIWHCIYIGYIYSSHWMVVVGRRRWNGTKSRTLINFFQFFHNHSIFSPQAGVNQGAPNYLQMCSRSREARDVRCGYLPNIRAVLWSPTSQESFRKKWV